MTNNKQRLTEELEQLTQMALLVPHMVHELNNQLGVLVMHLEARQLDGTVDESVSELVRTVEGQTGRMRTFLERTYELANLVQGQRDIIDVAEQFHGLREGFPRPIEVTIPEVPLRMEAVPNLFDWLMCEVVALFEPRSLQVHVEALDVALPIPGRARFRPVIRIAFGEEIGEIPSTDPVFQGFFRPGVGTEGLRWVAIRELVRRWGGKCGLVGDIVEPRGVLLQFPHLIEESD